MSSASPDRFARQLIVAASLLLAIGTPVRAQLLAYEPFNYSTGSSFATAGTTAATGTGYSGNLFWGLGTTSASILQSGSLSYTDGNSLALPTSDNYYENGHGRLAATFDLGGGGPFASYLESGRIGANGTTIYLSFVLQKASSSTSGYGAFELFRGGTADTARILSINTWSGQSAANYHLTVAEGANSGTFGGGAASGINANLGFVNASANFFVIRIDFGSGTDTATIYANPLLTTEPGSATGQVSASDLSFDRIASSIFSGAPMLSMDEIRVGTSYLSVTAIPEPSTFGLIAGVAVLGFLVIRRRAPARR